MYTDIQGYAESLVKYRLYSNINDAYKESERWHRKQNQGLEEPLQCPYNSNTNNLDIIYENNIQAKNKR